jgi:hypothetical protein
VQDEQTHLCFDKHGIHARVLTKSMVFMRAGWAQVQRLTRVVVVAVLGECSVGHGFG